MKIFVTDATSYLNSYICLYALELGHSLILGIPSKTKKQHVGLFDSISRKFRDKFEAVEIDFHKERALKEVIEKSDCIIHSLVEDTPEVPNNPTKLIKSSINRVMMLMKIAKKMKVKRLIFSGDVSSVYGGKKGSEFKDGDWAELKNIGSLQRAYLYTERTVWYQNKKEWDNYFDLTVLNLGLMVGPSLGFHSDHSSNLFVSRLLLGKMSQVLKVQLPTIDVRDAALVHLHILEKSKTFGERFNVIQGCHWMRDIADILSDEFEQYGYEVSVSEIGKFPVMLLSLFDKTCKRKLFGYGKAIKISNWKIKKFFTPKYRALDESLIDMGYDLIDKGLDTNDSIADTKFFDSRRESGTKRSVLKKEDHIDYKEDEEVLLGEEKERVLRGTENESELLGYGDNQGSKPKPE